MKKFKIDKNGSTRLAALSAAGLIAIVGLYGFSAYYLLKDRNEIKNSSTISYVTVVDTNKENEYYTTGLYLLENKETGKKIICKSELSSFSFSNIVVAMCGGIANYVDVDTGDLITKAYRGADGEYASSDYKITRISDILEGYASGEKITLDSLKKDLLNNEKEILKNK